MFSYEELMTDIMNSINNPDKAPFRVAFEIFSPDRMRLINYERTLRELESLPLEKFAFQTSSLPEDFKSEMIEDHKNDMPKAEDIVKNLTIDTAQYNGLKQYFEEKIRELCLKDPLIFFDDKAYRIDIGYGPKEFDALFPYFTAYHGIFQETFCPEAHIFQNLTPVFRDNCIKPDYGSYIQAEIKDLLEKASTEFAKKLPPKKELTLEETDNWHEVPLITECLKQFDGICIGEAHHHKSPKQFLIDNMPLLRAQGVTTLYMEHLLEVHQALLDEYLSSPSNAPMPKVLELYLKYLDRGFNVVGTSRFTDVIEAAKRNGIRVVGIDTEATYQIGEKNNLYDLNNRQSRSNRCKAMNMQMLKCFHQYHDGEKYVTFTGSAHVATCDGVPGVSDLLGCPNIFIMDLKKKQKEKIEQQVHFVEGKTTIDFDFMYYRNQESKKSITLFKNQSNGFFYPHNKMQSEIQQSSLEQGALANPEFRIEVEGKPFDEKSHSELTRDMMLHIKMLIDNGTNAYELLGVVQEATETEIKKAFHKMALLHHPDKNPNTSKELMQTLNIAYKVLIDPAARIEYDLSANLISPYVQKPR